MNKRVLLAFAVGFGVFAGVYLGLSYAAASTPNAEFVGTAAAAEESDDDEDDDDGIPDNVVLEDPEGEWVITDIDSRDGHILVDVKNTHFNNVRVSYADVSAASTGESGTASIVATESTTISPGESDTIRVSASSSDRGQIGLITIEGSNVLLEGEPAPGGGLMDVVDSTTAFLIGTVGGTAAVALYLWKKSDNDFNAPLKDDEAYKQSFK